MKLFESLKFFSLLFVLLILLLVIYYSTYRKHYKNEYFSIPEADLNYSLVLAKRNTHEAKKLNRNVKCARNKLLKLNHHRHYNKMNIHKELNKINKAVKNTISADSEKNKSYNDIREWTYRETQNF